MKRSTLRHFCQVYRALVAMLCFGVTALGSEFIPELNYYAEFPDGHIERREYAGEKLKDKNGETYFLFTKPIQVKGKRQGKIDVNFTFQKYYRLSVPDKIGFILGEDEFHNQVRVTFLRTHFVVEVAIKYKSGPLVGQFTKYEVKNSEQLKLDLPFNSPALYVYPQSSE